MIVLNDYNMIKYGMRQQYYSYHRFGQNYDFILYTKMKTSRTRTKLKFYSNTHDYNKTIYTK